MVVVPVVVVRVVVVRVVVVRVVLEHFLAVRSGPVLVILLVKTIARRARLTDSFELFAVKPQGMLWGFFHWGCCFLIILFSV